MATLTPTRMQGTVLLHLLTGGAYRLERGTEVVVAYDGQTLNTSTVNEVVQNGWAAYGDLLPSMQRLLHLTDVAVGNSWPEHDYPPVGEGNECCRCGAEADATEK